MGKEERDVPERALDLEAEDLGLGWWLGGSWASDLRLLLDLGTQIFKYILVQLDVCTSTLVCIYNLKDFIIRIGSFVVNGNFKRFFFLSCKGIDVHNVKTIASFP